MKHVRMEKPAMKQLRRTVILVLLAIGALAQAQSPAKPATARDRLLGAWHLVHIDAPGPDGKPDTTPQPIGILLYTPDGHMSVQLMYPSSQIALSNQYVQNGYEASFGSFDVNEATHTLIHHVQGSVTRDQLVGQNLPRSIEFTADGNLIIRSTRADEHWFVVWKHY